MPNSARTGECVNHSRRRKLVSRRICPITTAQTRSMQCGLRAVPPGADGVLFTLVDHPAVAPATLDALLGGPGPRDSDVARESSHAGETACATTVTGLPSRSEE